MILTLDEKTLKIIFARGIVTRDTLNEEKKKSRLGRKNCCVVKRFVAAIREDFTDLFPKKPCDRRLLRLSSRLFKLGGKFIFPNSLITDTKF